jgi:fatty acid desaturase
MDSASSIEAVEEKYEPHWASRSAFQLLVFAMVANQLTLFAALYHGWTWAVVVLILTGSHFMHGVLIGFHEASHGLLRENRKFNEFDGVLIGVLSLTSFSLYRAAHQSHHAYLSTERDEELWPFVQTSSPRGWRVTFAILELTFGLFFTPFIFMRTFLRKNSPIRNKRVRRRVWAEYALTASFWTTVLILVAHFGVWKYFLCLYFFPAFIAANLQSWRKYIEQVGMTGSTINGCTRSIITPTWMGRLVAFTLLHEPFHGVHHRHAGLPHSELPGRLEVLQPKEPDDLPPFPSYRHAFVHLLKNLANPKVGSQWLREPSSGSPS